MIGHWYCSFCSDVIPNLRKPIGRWDDRHCVCPVCHNHSCEWVEVKEKPATPSPERASELFGEMKKAVK